ncbi:zinc finger transcription factor family protein 17 [Ditylenchus destructor]|uniref:Zinc finger transcription factor family protein 17 n=1 Tax=Ditylenchus destructor TaxID=166010 RepID=A0AAD4NFA2_9BILA|nr:zinc finger transcription factor family protein 17 [Ditylenchus destructor]
MEGSVPNLTGFDIASIVGRLSTSPSKTLIDPSLTNLLNQHIKSIVEHYAASTAAVPNPMILQKSACTNAIVPEEIQSTSVDIKDEPFIDVQNNTPPPASTGEEELGEAMKSRGTRHAEDEHGLILPIIYKNFETQQEFDKWISYLREERNTEFVSKCGRKRLSNGSLLGYLVCAKSGSEAWKNKKKTAKSLKTCSAYLKVLRNETTGRIEIEGCLDHTGHEFMLTESKSTSIEHSNGWLNEGAPFTEVCAQIESRRVGESSYLNCHPVNETVQVDELNSKSLDIINANPAVSDTMMNFLNILRQKDVDANLKQPKQLSLPDNPASSNMELTSKRIQRNSDSTASVKSLGCAYVNVDLERRKLAMLEQFQGLQLRVLTLWRGLLIEDCHVPSPSIDRWLNNASFLTLPCVPGVSLIVCGFYPAGRTPKCVLQGIRVCRAHSSAIPRSSFLFLQT